MNSASSNASTPGGKSLNVSSSHSPLQQQQSQVVSPSFESRRSASHSTPSHSFPSPRNNQGNKKQHKNTRRPRLADEDAMAESVSQSQYLTSITCSPGALNNAVVANVLTRTSREP